jgi:hypothetical protein
VKWWCVTSTRPSPLTIEQERRGRAWRRVGIAAFTLLVLAGVAGLLGVRTTTTSSSSGPLTVSVTHAQVARPALAVPYRLSIRQDGGFDEQIEVRITTRYLEAFDENGRNPEPAESSTDEDETIWTFDPPDGEVLTVWLDTRVEPGVQWRVGGRTTVSTGAATVRVDHPIWIFP